MSADRLRKLQVQEFQATLASLQQVLSTLASQPGTPAHRAGRSAGSRIQSVVDWGCNLGRRLVLQVRPVVALFQTPFTSFISWHFTLTS